ncbi:MAG: hypothetical protein EHM19_09775, partial [Candidatus Latescibacterota bacterium]
MTNEELARALREIADLLELRGESVFHARAYAKAADRIEEAGDLVRLAREGRLTEIEGIGKGLADKIGYFLATGKIPLLEELRSEIPAGVVEMARVPGLGPTRIRAIREALAVRSIEELEQALAEGRLSGVKGIGPKVIADIEKGLRLLRETRGLRLHRPARREAERIAGDLLAIGAEKAEIAGDLARWLETVREIAIVAAHADEAAFMEKACARFPGAVRDGAILRFSSESGLPVRVRVAAPRGFGAALVLETGSADHLRLLERRAAERSLLFDEKGLHSGGDLLPTPDEIAFYSRLGLPPIPPEVREGTIEIEAAIADPFPALIERSDIRGIVHAHTTWSDGTASLREMAEAARALGFEYLAIADHSRSAGYAGGLSVERLLAQKEEVRALAAELAPFRLFHGIESDILADGSLDYPDEVLAELDFVVASVHSRFGLPREEQTARIVRAVRNPFTTVLGHPSGRLLLSRAPYEFDSGPVWEAAA